jgi:DNA-binding response OmpR family regulator
VTVDDNRRGEQGSDRRRQPRGGRRTSDTPGRGPIVLVADADSGARRPCVTYLIRRGFLVDEASSGREAASAVTMMHPQLVLLDAALSSKALLLMSIREAAIPTIVMTTDFMESTGSPGGALVKPFALDALLEEIRRVLRTDGPSAGGASETI